MAQKTFEQIAQEAKARYTAEPVQPIQPTQTAGDIYGDLSFETPEQRAFKDQQAEQARLTATTPIDEANLRQQTQARFQAEIDALNRVYAEKKRQEQIVGQGRLGSVGAVQARRGLLGSDFGQAQTVGQENLNTEALDAVESERIMKENAILSESRRLADAEIEKKTAAKQAGADAYIKYISESAQTKKTNAGIIAKRLYDQGIEPNFQAISKELGISAEALKSVYNEYKKEQDTVKEQQAQAEAQAQVEAQAKLLKEQEADKAKLTKEDLDRQTGLLKDGYVYVQTPAERDALKKQGYTIATLGGRTYAKAPKLTTKTVKVGSTTYSITTNEAGEIVSKTLVAGGGGGGGVPSGAVTEKSAIKDIENIIGGAVGDDGFISPQEYTNLRNQWIQQGLNPTSFDTKMKGYRNPNNPNYVIVKQ